MTSDNGTKPSSSQPTERKCGICSQQRSTSHFFDLPHCIFCAIDRAEHNLSRLQDKLNFSPPNNGPLKRNCKRCKDFVWWVNLSDSGHCPPCVDAISELASNPVKQEGEGLELDIDEILSNLMEVEL